MNVLTIALALVTFACSSLCDDASSSSEPTSPPGDPGLWTELSDTRFDRSPAICGQPGAAAAPACLPSSLPAGGNDEVANAITAWVSGDYDGSRGWLIIPRGGGHADWAGNQVIAFDVPNGRWRLVTPTSFAAVRMSSSTASTEYTNPYADGSPASVHSYDAVAWMPWIDQMWSSGGIYWSPGGQSDRNTFWWDPNGEGLAAWTAKAPRPGGYATTAVADVAEKRLWVRYNGGFAAYDPTTDTYTQLFSASGVAAETSPLALDPVGRALYRFNKQSSEFAIRRIDLTNPAGGEVLLAVSGDTAVQTIAGAGLMWDAGRLVAFGPGITSGTGALYTLDPTGCGTAQLPACVWIRHDPLDGIHPPRGAVQGIWKRWFRHGCDYYVVLDGRTNVWKIRPPWQTDTCVTQ